MDMFPASTSTLLFLFSWMLFTLSEIFDETLHYEKTVELYTIHVHAGFGDHDRFHGHRG